MNKIQEKKQKQLNDIVSIVKVSSLLFVGIILLQYITEKKQAISYSIAFYYLIIGIILPLLLLIFVYFLWTFSDKNKINGKFENKITYIESIGFITIFTLVIVFCGGNQSKFKVLYLFIIIATTIQHGMKSGIIISSISSIIILIVDLIIMPGVVVNTYFQDDLILVGMFFLTVWPLGYYVRTEKDHIKILENQVNIDGLTGVYNHRFFHETLAKNIKLGEEQRKPVSMIFIDIDYFKHYNDLYGHQKGDMILKNLAQILKEKVRKEDFVARYGGEEFAIILFDTEEEVALKIAEKLRSVIENSYFEGEENQPNGKLTASFGISVYPNKAKNDLELIKSADDALYRAKFFNKNRVEAYTSILDEIKENIDEKDVELVASIKTLISVINAKDRYTYGHVERVVVYCRYMAKQLKLSTEEENNLIYGAYMHDIGKINISKEILTKRMKLEDYEWEQLKQHPTNGVEIIKSVEALKGIRPLIEFHHERYDGLGYPSGLKGEKIPYLARALSIADSFDAMTSNRPYNIAKTFQEGIDELRRCKGTQFDPQLVEIFIKAISNIN